MDQFDLVFLSDGKHFHFVLVLLVYQILVPSVKKSNRKSGRLPRLIE